MSLLLEFSVLLNIILLFIAASAFVGRCFYPVVEHEAHEEMGRAAFSVVQVGFFMVFTFSFTATFIDVKLFECCKGHV